MSSDDAWKAEIWTKGFHQVAQFLFFLQRMLQNFKKKDGKCNCFLSRYLLEGNQGREDTKAPAAPPVQMKHRHCSAAPQIRPSRLCLREQLEGKDWLCSREAPRKLL